MAFIGMPGPFEMLIILVMGCFVFGLPILILVLIARGRQNSVHARPACPHCQGWTVPQANYCQWCGKSLTAGRSS